MATRASIRGPISSLSWNDQVKSAYPALPNSRCEPFTRFSRQPALRRAASTCLALTDGQRLKRPEGDVREIRSGHLPLLEPIGQYPQGKRLRRALRLLGGQPVDENPGKLQNIGDPTPILLALELDREPHGCPILAFVQLCFPDSEAPRVRGILRGAASAERLPGPIPEGSGMKGRLHVPSLAYSIAFAERFPI